MIPSQNQQAHLADFAPKQSLDKYAKGADPRVINGIVALSEMQQQAAMRQQANLANGAAQGQMPTVRDKIMQMFQQANQPRQQPQQQPNPMQQGIMAQAHPQMQTAPMPRGEAPEEAQMYHGGVARLPVNDRMFGYANGGIIAFRKGDEVPKADEEAKDDEPLSKDEAEAIRRRMKQRTDMTPEKMDVTDLDFTSIPGLEKSDLRQKAMAEIPKEEPESEMMRAVKTPFRALGEGIKSLYKSAPGTEPTPIGVADQDLSAAIMAAADTAKPTAAPVPRRDPKQIDLEKLHQLAIAGGNSSMSPSRKGIAQNIAPPSAGPGGPTPPTSPTIRPGAAQAQTAPTGIDALLAQQANRLATQGTSVGPQLPEPDMAANTLKLLEAQEKYVRDNPNSPAADKLLQHYDDMRKRAIADDNAQLAQRAEDDRNNLWTLLTNTRGSSLAAGAGRANAALQPLLSEQKAAAAAYRKYSYERDLNLNKADAELRMAEEERKRNRFDKALVHEEAARSYRLDAKKAEDTAQHYRNTEMNQVLSTAATRESAKEGHLTQIQVANINAAAQRAGFNKPSESKQLTDEYLSRVQKDGQAAADAWLKSVGKVLGVTKGYDTREGSLDVARHKEVRTALENDNVYNSITRELNKLEKAALKKPLDREQAAYLQRLRTRQQELYNNKYRELYREAPTAQPSGETGGASSGATPMPQSQAELQNGTVYQTSRGPARWDAAKKQFFPV